MALEYKQIQGGKFNRLNVPDSEKGRGAKYYVDNCKAILSSYFSNDMVMGINYVNGLAVNRLYASGKVDMTRIKPKDNNTLPSNAAWDDDISNKLNRSNVRDLKEGWNLVDWDTYSSPAPKLLSVLEDQALAVDYNVSAEVIDPISKDEELDKKWRTMATAKMVDLQQKVANFSGVPMSEQMILPESNEELEMIALAGGFKHRHAIATQNALKNVFEYSRWNFDRERWISDMWCSQYVCALCNVDPVSGQLTTEYVDPENATIQYSEYPDHRDSEYGSVWFYKSISELMAMGLTTEQIKEVAKVWSGAIGSNGLKSNSNIDDLIGTKAQVARCFWVDVTNGRRTIMEASYIVGTEIVYNEGLSQVQGRWNNSLDVHLPLIVIKRNKAPLMELMRSWIDLFIIGEKKLELAIKKARPNGMAINVAMLNNSAAGMSGNAMDFIKMFGDTRLLPYMQSVTGQYGGGAVTPIMPISGDVGPLFDNAIATMERAIAGLYEVTGLNPQILSAILPVGSRTATEASYQMAQTNAVIRPYIYQLQQLKERIAIVTKSRMRTQAQNPSKFKNTYKYLLSEADMDALILEASRQGECRLKMVVKPTDQFRAEMKAQVSQLVQLGALRADDEMYIAEMLNQGVDLPLVRMYIGYRAKKMADEQHQRVIEQQQAQAQGNIAFEQAQAQTATNKVQQEGQIKGTIEAMKVGEQMKNNIAMEQEKRKTIMVQALANVLQKIEDQTQLQALMGGGVNE